jgi:hypothetical protein
VNAVADTAATDGRGTSLVTDFAHPIADAISTTSLSSSNTDRNNCYFPFNRRKGLVQNSRRTPQQKRHSKRNALKCLSARGSLLAGMYNMCWITDNMHQSRSTFSIGQHMHQRTLELMSKETPFYK